MLIKCPECGKEIYSFDEVCIYCGYPLKKSTIQETDDNICYINDIPYDLSEVLTYIQRNKYLNAIKALEDMANIGLKGCKGICDEIRETKRIPSKYYC